MASVRDVFGPHRKVDVAHWAPSVNRKEVIPMARRKDVFLSRRAVEHRTGLSRSTIYK